MLLNSELKKAFIKLAQTPDSNSDLVLNFYRLAPPPVVSFYQNLYLTSGGAGEVLQKGYLRSRTDFDFEKLAEYNPDSLGYTWYHFIRDNGLYPDLLGAEILKLYPPDSDMYVVTCRSLETHDLLHVVAGYGPDAYGEFAVASFTASQRYNLTGLTWWPLLVTRLTFVVPDQTVPIMDMLTDNWLRGIQAQNLLSANWEERLDWPLEQVRQALNLAGQAPIGKDLIAKINGPYPPEARIAPAVEKLFWELVEEMADLSQLMKKIPHLISLHDENLRESYRAEMFAHRGVVQTLEQGESRLYDNLQELQDCPPGSLGQALYRRLAGRPTNEAGHFSQDDLVENLHQASDIWACLLDLGESEDDTVALQAFQLAQVGDPFSANLLAVLVMQAMTLEPQKLPWLIKAIAIGWWAGRRARPLLPVPWASYLKDNLIELRREYRVEYGIS